MRVCVLEQETPEKAWFWLGMGDRGRVSVTQSQLHTMSTLVIKVVESVFGVGGWHVGPGTHLS